MLIVLPFPLSDFRTVQLATVGAYFIAILGLDILTGHSGQISLGHGAFMAVGALHDGDPDGEPRRPRPLDDPDRRAASPAAIGLLAGIPALRLSGLYLALATFGIAVVAADDPEEVRPLHRRLDGHHALRQADADGPRRRGDDPRRAPDEQRSGCTR